ncbi:MAG: hypothetical protein HRT68_15605, partial [Flavobacteriaceae bacterium]|nr:hypothetical protein [Flavobacteriaceae bacterium]
MKFNRLILVLLFIVFNANNLYSQDVIPVACSTATYNVNTGDVFYDDGGPGGCLCADGAGCPGEYANAGCITTVTLCPPAGGCGNVSVTFNVFAMFNTASAFDWMKIYDSADTTGAILFDNDIGGPNIPYGTCGDDPVFTVTATNPSGCLTFEFNATTVVSRAGWEAPVTIVGGGGGANAGTDGSIDICDDSTTLIDLYSLITGEDTGGTWVRTSGTGGTFNAAAGTFLPAPGATTSTFEYTV